jgi:hypothetical protein
MLNCITGEITKDKLKKVGESLVDFDLGGLQLSFNPATRCLMQHVWIDPGINQEWIQKNIQKVTVQ